MYLVAKARARQSQAEHEDGERLFRKRDAPGYLCARDVEVDELIELVLPRRFLEKRRAGTRTARNAVKKYGECKITRNSVRVRPVYLLIRC